MLLRQLPALGLIALFAAACSPKKAQVHEVDEKEQVPGLVDVQMHGFTRENTQLAAGLGEILSERETEEDDTDLFLPREQFSEQLFVLRIEPSKVQQALAALRARPDVVYAEPVVKLHALWVPNDPEYPRQWHLGMAGAEGAWDIARGGGVKVAVIDTGVAAVSDLDRGRLLTGFNFLTNKPGGADDNGHGTHVAGTIAQATGNGKGTAGMAPEASILPLKVLSAFGSGDSAGISLAIRAAADQGARVINLSLGGGGRSESMAAAVAYARRKGVFVAAAAGNSGGRGVSYPAAYDGAFAVSAVGPQGLLAPYSTFGQEVQLAAPGGDKSQGDEKGVLQQTIDPEQGKGAPEGSYRWFQGTSMATPHVAGAAALLVSAGVTNPATVGRVLRATAARPGSFDQGAADPPAEALQAEKYGAGLLDAHAALRRVTLVWGLLQLLFAAAGAALAVAQAKKLGQLRRTAELGVGFWGALVLAAGGLAVLAPLGLARLPLGGALVLPWAGMPAHWLGPAGSGALATGAAYLGWSGIVPFVLATFARAAASRGAGPGPFALVIAGFSFGTAGLLLNAAVQQRIMLPWMPALLVPVWLVLGALLSWFVGRGLLARESL